MSLWQVSKLKRFLFLSLWLSTCIAASKQNREERQDHYRKWLEADVVYLITDEEKAVFEALATEEEKERFIEAFWRRRDSDPNTLENEFKDEHYRRIAYANEKFSAGIAGWLTDRGRMYIQYGPPAQVDVYPTGTVLQDPRGGVIQALGGADVRGGVRSRDIRTYPFEVWRYRYIEGIGGDVTVEFVDRTGSGLYTLAMDEEEKNVFAHRDPAADVASLNRSDFLKLNKERQFYQTELFAKLAAPPAVKFNDLRQAVSSRVHYDQIPFKVAMSLLRVTDSSFYVPVSFVLSARDLDFRQEGEIWRASVNIFLQATSVQKQVAAVVEDTLRLQGSSAELERLRRGNALYQKKLLLPPGRYVIDLVLQDTNSKKLGSFQQLVVVPEPREKPWLSSLVLADLMRPLRDDEALTDPFAIGAQKVVPNLERRFRPSERLGLFFQIYGLAIDASTSRPDAELQVTLKQSDRTLLTLKDDLSRFGSFHGESASITIGVPLKDFPEGRIDLEVQVTDRIADRTAQAESDFVVSVF